MLTRWAYYMLLNIASLGKAKNILDEKGSERRYEPDILVRAYNFVAKAKIGKSNIPPTTDQFNLSEPYMESSSLKVNFEEAEGRYSLIIEASFDIPEEVTIYEVGLFGKFRDFFFMVDRSVISEGIQLLAGQRLKVTWKITLA